MTDEPQDAQSRAKQIGLWLGPGLALLIMVLPDLDPANPNVSRMAAVAVWMAVWWMAEALPLAITALLPVLMYPLLGIMNGKTVSGSYINYIIFLFLGGFMVALAMEKWNLHKRIALKILVKVGNKPKGVLLGFMVATAFLSMWISNTATAMMMTPIAMALIVNLGGAMDAKKLAKYGVGLMLGIAYAASIGGIATPVGTPPNLIFMETFGNQFPNLPEISFPAWMGFALPFSFCFLIAVWYFLVRGYTPKETQGNVAGDTFGAQLKELGKTTYEEKVVGVVFAALALLWLTRKDLNLGAVEIPGWAGLFPNAGFFNDGTVSVLMALVLFLVPSKRCQSGKIMDWETAKRLPWDIVLLFGGGFALAAGFKESGLSQFVAAKLATAEALPLLLIIFIICFTITFLTELTSNMTTAQIFLPLLAVFAVTLEVHPMLTMAPATLACSFAFMLPVATPPNAIVFGSGMINVAQMARAGIWINLLAIIAITLYSWFLAPWLLGIDLTVLPAAAVP